MHLLAQSEIRRIDETKLKLWLVISESRPQSVFKIGGISKRCQGMTPKADPHLWRGFVPPNLLWLQLPSGLLEEPGCPICEGFVPHIIRFGSTAKASIFPKSGPIVRIHFVFDRSDLVDLVLRFPF
jgi:hypothetical protein